jgi:ribosomal protein S12 methylthiotransferase
VQRLADESGAEWIRLMYAYPSKFPHDLLPVIRNNSNVCTYLDMPLQHASSEVLKNMRRGITRRTTEELLDRIRQEVPGIVLRSTFIVGYPSETERDVDELADFVHRQQFDRIGVFTYSQEDDTYAYILGDPISADVKEERRKRIMAIQQQVSYQKNQTKIGSVLVEEILNGEYRGRTEGDAPEVDNDVYIRTNQRIELGSFVNVVIDDAIEFDLFGTPEAN